MSQFEEFLNKVQEPGLILERFGALDIHECLISEIISYLRNTSLKQANQFKDIIEDIGTLPPESFSLSLINNLVQSFAGVKETPQNFAEMVKSKFILNSLSYSFQNHLEDMKINKFEINDTINKKESDDDYCFEEKKTLKNLLSKSSSVFHFWYLLHQNVETKLKPHYNFFDTQKSHKHMPNLKQGFSFQNFDHVQRSSHSPTFFVLSMITNLEDLEDEAEQAQFCLIGIYLDNGTLHSYRYELKEPSELASMHFFDAVEMLAN